MSKPRGGGKGGSGRGLGERLKSDKRRTASSRRWLTRQLSDQYVHQARRSGYRSRAAFKLAQIDDQVRLLKRGARVVDLGAAPGGWTQVALERVGRGGKVVGIDVTEIEPIPGAILLVGDVREPAWGPLQK